MRISSSDGKTILQTLIIPVQQDFYQALGDFKKAADQLIETEKVDAIAGGIAGPLNHEKSMLTAAPSLKDWIGKPLKEELKRMFLSPVILENDTAMGGLGEAVFGAGRGQPIVAYLAPGTGLGGVRVVDGRIDRNSHGFEPGHQIIVPNGAQCHCGGKGHLEAYVGGGYMEKNYGQRGENITDGRIWDEVAKYMAIGITNTVMLWSPTVVVLSGSITKSLPIAKVEEYYLADVKIFSDPPAIVKAQLGDTTGAYGALALIQQNL